MLAVASAGAMYFAGVGSAKAGSPAVLFAEAVANSDGTYAITATVTHRDEGWTHYLDRWDVLDPSGRVLASRTLYHPHVDEQPFTRSLGRVEVPVGVAEVTIRAHCKVDGDGTRTFTLKLPPRR